MRRSGVVRRCCRGQRRKRCTEAWREGVGATRLRAAALEARAVLGAGRAFALPRCADGMARARARARPSLGVGPLAS